MLVRALLQQVAPHAEKMKVPGFRILLQFFLVNDGLSLAGPIPEAKRQGVRSVRLVEGPLGFDGLGVLAEDLLQLRLEVAHLGTPLLRLFQARINGDGFHDWPLLMEPWNYFWNSTRWPALETR